MYMLYIHVIYMATSARDQHQAGRARGHPSCGELNTISPTIIAVLKRKRC